MANPLELVGRKLHRAAEMVNLLTNYAADGETRKALFHVYASLSHRERYDDEVKLNLRIRDQVFPFYMRISDIFIIGEILHEKQYRLETDLPDAPVVVDLGANIGISALWFLALRPNARIHAFEPAADNLAFLEKNFAGLENITLQKMAVGDVTGSATLHHGEFGGMHSLLIDGEGETVPLVSLADYMAQQNIDKIDLLKLDIEGSELDAMKGLGPRIKDVRAIIGEVHEAIVDEDAFYAFLKDNGFKVLWKRFFQESREQQVHGFEAVRAA